MTRNIGTNTDLEAAIQNVICAADLASGPIEAAISGETACYAFYKLLEEIDALRRVADAAYPAAQCYPAAQACHAAQAHQPAVTPDWTGSRHG